ncbi:AAA family ATPase [Pseudalkalibacillus salsuginis]|uniref:AAA family ATPase n=1 Tax=Pseudalkalibacillus salsuginis TaxID=2910972 RepID=UPI001F320045|nr:AAA family ATPase [Pseudalkalibacillus salsuginis]MCF6410206.1 AAA family ATPase [Pseudalkalibacillus salsuginis]
MNMGIPNKIHIIGSVGSGKTTLARTLSNSFNVPFYELDNVVWQRHESGDIRRPDEERDKYLDNIISTERWIIEGSHSHSWVGKSFQTADLIIFLDTPYPKRIQRIIKRFILQKLGLEKANYVPTLSMFRKMFKWNSSFEKESKPEILKMLTDEGFNSIILKDNTNIDNYLND